MVEKCIAITAKGRRCKNSSRYEKQTCWIHRALDEQRNLTTRIVQRVVKPSFPEIMDRYKQAVQLEQSNLTTRIANRVVQNIKTSLPAMMTHSRILEALSSITTCKCCYNDQVPNNQLIRCSNVSCENGHFACVDCIRGYVDSNIQAGASLKCMFGCEGVYDRDIMRMALTVETFSKFCIALEIQEVSEIANILANYQICPFCSRYGCVVDTPQQVKCVKCDNIWCSKCRRRNHAGDCYSLLFGQDETILEKCNTVDKMLQELSTNALSHSCSSCGVKFYKEEGCNHMVCPRCRTSSCYVCGVKIERKMILTLLGMVPSEYYHFKGSPLADATATCPLYNGFRYLETGKSGINLSVRFFIIIFLDPLTSLSQLNPHFLHVYFSEDPTLFRTPHPPHVLEV